jgi:NTP pyrophosphatase (non-canonical NTP hydrolase)
MDRLAVMLAEIRAFVQEREWEPFHDPKNLAMAVVSEAGELAAELRWVRNEDSDSFCREPESRARVADEIADVAITLLMMADRVDLDLVQCVQQKLEKNRAKYPVESARGRPESP